MSLIDLSLWLLAAAGSIVLFASSILVVVIFRRCRALIDLRSPDPEVWPRLSVLVPACNEADTLEAALMSLARVDYPELEIVVINDRSTDETGLILERLAKSDPRIIPVQVTTLPEGWLGKVHALARGLEKSRGKWVLFTDADVHFEATALRRAIAHAEAKRLNHLALLPEIPMDGFLLGISIAAAFRSLILMTRMWQVNDPNASRGMGVGAFNLVRREALDATAGLEWFRLEVADDVALGIMMKQQAGGSELLVGRGLTSVNWYPTLGAAVRGLEKNGFAQAARFRATRGFLMSVAAAALAVAPFLALLPSNPLALRLFGLLALGTHVAISVFVGPRFAVQRAHLIFSLPLGDLIMAFIILRATWNGLRRGGVVWRGTHYSSAVLAAGRRVDL